MHYRNYTKSATHETNMEKKHKKHRKPELPENRRGRKVCCCSQTVLFVSLCFNCSISVLRVLLVSPCPYAGRTEYLQAVGDTIDGKNNSDCSLIL